MKKIFQAQTNEMTISKNIDKPSLDYISFLSFIFLFLLVSINTFETKGYNLVLNDASSTIDGTTLSSTEVNGVTYIDSIVKITLEGTCWGLGPIPITIKKS